jgi:hypothetical protein
MNTTTERTLATLVGGLPALLAPISAAMADTTPMGGGMMGNGSMYGFNSAWLIALVVVVAGVVLVAALRTKR